MFKSVALFFLAVVSLLASNNNIYDQEIHNAVRNNNFEMLKYTVENARESINEKDDLGYTPLHLAVRKNDNKTVNFILEFDPKVNTQDKFGDTPLIDSARNNNMEIVKLLICAGADKYTKNKNNKTAMDFISDNKQYETALFMKNPKCTKNNEQEKKNLIEKLRKLK